MQYRQTGGGRSGDWLHVYHRNTGDKIDEIRLSAGSNQKLVQKLSPRHDLIATLGGSKLIVYRYDADERRFAKTELAIRPTHEASLKWHSSEPIFAWANGNYATLYDTEHEELRSTLLPNVNSILAVPEGWVVTSTSSIKKFDRLGDLVKTHFCSQPFQGYEHEGRFDQWVTSEGNFRRENAQELRLVQRIGNRFETRPVSLLDPETGSAEDGD